MSLNRIEDLFLGYNSMLAYLVEDLVFKGKLNEARGIYDRHNLLGNVRKDANERLMDVIYDPKKEKKFEDAFGPITEGALKLPENLNVEFIEKEEEIGRLD